MPKELDLYDKKILYHLDMNSRESATSISKKIRLPKETVNYRIQRLKEQEYIKKFYMMTDASKLGYGYYKIFLKFHKFTKDREQQVLNFLKKEKCCIHLCIIDGVYDLSIITIHKHPSDVRIFMQKISDMFGEFLLEKNIHTIITSHKLNQKLFYQEDVVRKSMYHGEPTNYKLDSIDKEILKKLAANARIKIMDLAKMLKQDPRLVRYHLKKLEKDKIIFDYSISLNVEKGLYEPIQIDMKVKNLKKIRNIIEYFDSTNTCIFAFETIGVYDLSLNLYIQNDEQLRQILNKFKETFFDHYIDYEVSYINDEEIINFTGL